MQTIMSIVNNIKTDLNPIVLGILLLTFLSSSYAQDNIDSTQLALDLASDSLIQENSISQENIPSGINAIQVVPENSKNLVWGKLHKILGFSAVVCGITTAILNQQNTSETLDKSFEISTASLALLSMTTGVISHWDEISPKKNKFSYKHVHAILGIAGGYMLIAAPFITNEKAQNIVGISGTVGLGASLTLAVIF